MTRHWIPIARSTYALFREKLENIPSHVLPQSQVSGITHRSLQHLACIVSGSKF